MAFLRRRGAAKLEYAFLTFLLGGITVGGLVVFGPTAGRLLGGGGIEAPDGGGPAADAPLEFLGQPLLAWQTSGDGFLTVPGAPETRTIELVNLGTGPSGPIGGVAVGAAPFSLVATDCAGPLGPGRTCFATVRHAPLESGAHAGAAVPGEGPAPPLSGDALGFVPAFAWSGGGPFAIDLAGAPGAPVADRTFLLTNVGTGRGPVAAPAVAGDGYALLSHDCPAVFDPGQSCAADVRLTADRNGAFPGTLAAGDAVQPLSGTASGLAPVFSWSRGGAFDLADPAATPGQVERTFTLTNTGTLGGVPAPVSVSGAGPGYAFTLAGTTCGAALAPGESCSATVRATYTANVSAAGTLGGPATQALAGSASGFVPNFSLTLASSVLQTFQSCSGSGDGETCQTNGRLVGTVLVAGTGTLSGQILSLVAADPSFAPGSCPSAGSGASATLALHTLAPGQS